MNIATTRTTPTPISPPAFTAPCDEAFRSVARLRRSRATNGNRFRGFVVALHGAMLIATALTTVALAMALIDPVADGGDIAGQPDTLPVLAEFKVARVARS